MATQREFTSDPQFNLEKSKDGVAWEMFFSTNDEEVALSRLRRALEEFSGYQVKLTITPGKTMMVTRHDK